MLFRGIFIAKEKRTGNWILYRKFDLIYSFKPNPTGVCKYFMPV